MWVQRYRMLLVAYGIALVVGAREYVVARASAAPDWMGGCRASAAACSSVSTRTGLAEDSTFWLQHRRMTEVVRRVNPDDPDTDFLVAMQALADGELDSTVLRLEEALAAGVKHNDYLLQYYAQYELNRGADWQRVNFAVNRWRQNHPFSAEPLAVPMGRGPASDAERALLLDELARIAWIGGARLESGTVDGETRWRVLLTFRPGREVDVREAVAAVTLLSLSHEQRSRFRVRCSTLVDCTLEPRVGGA